MIKYFLIAGFSGVLSAFAQVLLKKGSMSKSKTPFLEYLNLFVICGYGITFLCMILMIYAYRGVPFKYGTIIESLVFLYIMVLSRLFFKEKITRKKFLGNCLIITGVVIFSLQR